MSRLNVFLALLVLTILTTNHLFYTTSAEGCSSSGTVQGTQPPSDGCDPNGATCCQAGADYNTYKCSPSVSGSTSAVLTLNSFEDGGDGGGASSCDGNFHSDDTPVVALSTGWYNGGSRCGNEIVINGNGQTTTATVVDECDSTQGCDEEHGYQVPCRNNVVDASSAVWEALGVSSDSPDYGEMSITWSDV